MLGWHWVTCDICGVILRKSTDAERKQSVDETADNPYEYCVYCEVEHESALEAL